MVNSYNAPVLDGNTDLDGVYVYTKAKHRGNDESLIGILWRRWLMMCTLRAIKIDDVIIATTAAQPRIVKLARWLKPKRIIGYGNGGADLELPLAETPMHEVEDVFRTANIYGISGKPPTVHVLKTKQPSPSTIAIHISARKISQRWPTENFVELMHNLHAQDPALRFVLLWSPGASDNPLHPGDDAKAAAIIAALGEKFPVTAAATQTLQALIASLSDCEMLICADGGAMHLAAGLGLPVIALFGDSSVERWRPWGVSQQVLQTRSRNVTDISVPEVATAFNELWAQTKALSV